MKNFSVLNTVRGYTLRSFFVWLGVTVIAALILSLAFNAYRNALNGPFSMDRDTLISLDSLSGLDNYYVTVEGDDSLDTGFYRTSRWMGLIETGGREYFGALLLGEQLLLVETGEGQLANTQHTGELIAIPSDVSRNVLDKIYAEVPELRGRFLPFMLRENNFKLNTFLGAGIGFLLLGACIFRSLRALRFAVDGSNHPIMKRFQVYGDADGAITELETDMRLDTTAIGPFHFSAHWLLYRHWGVGLNAMRLADVVWMYQHITQVRTYGIPTGKTFSVVIWDKHGNRIQPSRLKKEQAHDVLVAIAQQTPWVVGGFSPELEQRWRKQRAEFVAQVEQRRQQMMSQRPS